MFNEKEFSRKHGESLTKIIDGLALEYSEFLENRSISEADKIAKNELGNIISYMDLSDAELSEKLYPLLNKLSESILNWDKEKAWITASNIKSIHQAAFDKARGVSKESLIQIYNMMP